MAGHGYAHFLSIESIPVHKSPDLSKNLASTNVVK
jgi:hypothetical protein